MRCSKRIQWVTVVTLLGVAGQLQAQDADSEKIDRITVSPPVKKQAQQDRSASRDVDQTERVEEEKSDKSSQVTAANRASSLVGMRVQNAQDEMLGEVEDLVVDLSDGRIAYVVLGVGGFLGVGERLIAVPPAAFRPGSEPGVLLLNADKRKIEEAPGFSSANWPALEGGAWGSGIWARDGGGQESDARVREATGTEGPRSAVTPERENNAGDEARSEQQLHRMRGTVTHINPDTGSLAVKAGEQSKAFVIHPQAKIEGSDGTGRLGDVKMGDVVTVEYQEGEDEIGVVRNISKLERPERDGER